MCNFTTGVWVTRVSKPEITANECRFTITKLELIDIDKINAYVMTVSFAVVLHTLLVKEKFKDF